jgi:hypothetical protein
MAADDMSFDDLPSFDDPGSADAGPFPLNRIVAFLGPYLAIASGVVADYLLVHVHLLATFHVNHNGLASALSQVAIFAITTLVVWAGHHKWLTGWQHWESSLGRAQMISSIGMAPASVGMTETMAATGNHPDGDYDPAEFGPDGSVKGKPGLDT